MKSSEIRQAFINYFKDHQHQVVPSSSLIPEDDPTLLFANAGMNQFKNTFTGVEKRDYKRATTSQKCVRAGGKHNDLDNVGHTARHHTFFEMLGNFSFGDYFKEEAIHYAWDFLTNTLKIPKDKLYITVFETDDEAAEIWQTQEKVPADRIFRFGEEDNFWRMGDTGPCGPCSEIFYDHGPEFGEYSSVQEGIASGDDRYVEIWNLVFMQYFENEKGEQTPLPNPSIDTGAGLERLAALLQNKHNNYDTDVFLNLIHEVERISQKKYKTPGQENDTAAMRVLADHARSCTFLIADGVMPSNEGRGYVLRRILRRAIRYGRNLTDKSLLPALVPKVIETMGDVYPELKQRQNLILQTIEDEEARFLQTLDQGTQILNEALKSFGKNSQKILNGETVFKLYDTYGFPVDLTKIMTAEKGFSIDEQAFEKCMEDARQKAKASWKGKGPSQDENHIIELTQEAKKTGEPIFSGYEKLQDQQQVLLISNGQKKVDELKAGEEGFLIFPSTPFYGESGGQIGDKGAISCDKISCKAEVIDCTKHQDVTLHHVKILEGSLQQGSLCHLQVDKVHRQNAMANHSATHLLHSALRQVLGTHVTQAGSLVTSDKLRFDFTHNQPVTTEQIAKIEELVQREIFNHDQVQTTEKTPDEAIAAGALALFGEKYGDKVRVVSMGEVSTEPFSVELCGGTHVANTSEIYDFIITAETGVSAGIRRLEAVTGHEALLLNQRSRRQLQLAQREIGNEHNRILSDIADFEEDQTKEIIVQRINDYKSKIKEQEKEIKSLKGGQIDLEGLFNSAEKFQAGDKEGLLITADLQLDDRKVLTEINDKLKDKIQTGVVITVGQGENSSPLIVSVSKDLTKTHNAGQLLKEMATVMGGKGGGRPDFAQGAAPDRSKISEAFAKVRTLVQS